LNIYYDFEHVEAIRNAVVTTGSFDGVHNGHQVIIERLKKWAFELRGESVLITFHPHPRQVLYPETTGKELKLITTLPEKIVLLEKAGLDNLIVATFTPEFSKITSLDFVKNFLLKKLNARKIVTGFNHQFGHNREGDAETLRQLGNQFGFEVDEIPEQDIELESVSSVTIRDALLKGDVRKANRYLNHSFLLTRRRNPGHRTTIHGQYKYRLTIPDPHKLIPPSGKYSVTAVEQDAHIRAVCRIENDFNDQNHQIVSFSSPSPLTSRSRQITLLFHDQLTDSHAY